MAPDMGLLKPDMVFFMDLAPKVAASRSEYGAERYERLDFQERIYANFMKLKEVDWILIDADTTPDALTLQIRQQLEQRVATQPAGPLAGLWTDA